MPTPPENNEPAAEHSDRYLPHGSANTSIRITPWQNGEEISRRERAGQLRQMVPIVGLVMVLTAWVYFNLGWLKRD